MSELPMNRLRAEAARHPYPLVFATISGAHLYGFESDDSDFDLRGAHVLPIADVVGLLDAKNTVDFHGPSDGLDTDLVTHDVAKFIRLLLKPNGYVLEQLYSPLVVLTTKEHDELKAIARGCITRNHAHHYLGFARTQWNLLTKEEPCRVKPLLYLYRVLLTGIHLVRTGQVEANLARLNNDSFRLGFLDELIDAKRSGREDTKINVADLAFHESEYARLRAQLEAERDKSKLPDRPTCRAALNDLLVRIRTKGLTA